MTGNYRILSLFIGIACLTSPATAQNVELIAGGGPGGSGGKATDAKLGQVFGVQFDPAGNLYVIEYTNRLWKVDPAGTITSIAGDGQKGNKGDGGPASAATFGGIYCVGFDPQCEHLVITDLDNKQIRVVDMKTGAVRHIAGNGQKGAPADGADARTAPLVDPRAATMDAAGNVYVLERSGHALRIVTPDGKIKTVVGTGTKGIGGDGGPATEAQLNGPKHLWIDTDGNVLIADTENHVIRKYDVKSGTIGRIAGNGTRGAGGVGGDPKQLQMSQPHGIYQAPDGSLYISDSMNGRVLRIK